MDMSKTLAPKSDQMDYEDLISGPLTLTITEVRKGPSAEQPVEIATKEFERPWRPAKTVRRVLVSCWGPDSSAYVGRQIRLFGDPTVTWAGEAVGGIRLSHLSHIDEPMTVSLTVRRGKRAPFTVQPLETPKDTSGRDWLKELNETNEDLDAIVALGHAARANHAGKTIIDMITAEWTRVKAGPA